MEGLIDYLSAEFQSVDEISDDWVSSTVDGNFTDFETISTAVKPSFFEHDEQAQLQLLRALSGRLLKFEENSDDADIWKNLIEKSVSGKKLAVLLWFCMEYAHAKESSAITIKSGISSACAYMYLCSIKGAQAFHVFNPYLYQRALELFRMMYREMTYECRETNTKKKGKGKGKAKSKQDDDVMDESGTAKIHWDKAELRELLEDATKSLFVVTNKVALSAFREAADATVLLVRDLACTDASRDTHVRPARSTREFCNLSRMSDRCFALMHRLCEDRHSHGGEIIYSRLVYPRLAFLGFDLSTVPSSSSIPSSYTQWKDLIVHFVECRATDASPQEIATIVKVLNNVYARCTDRQDYRTKISQTLVQLLLVLPVKIQYDFIQQVHQFSLNQRNSFRNLAIDIVPLLIKSIDFSVPDPTPLGVPTSADDTVHNATKARSNETIAKDADGQASDDDMDGDSEDEEEKEARRKAKKAAEQKKQQSKKNKKNAVVPRVDALSALYQCIMRSCADKSASIRGRALVQMASFLSDDRHFDTVVASADELHKKYPRMFVGVADEGKKKNGEDGDVEQDAVAEDVDVHLLDDDEQIDNLILYIITRGLIDEKANVRKAALVASQAYIPRIVNHMEIAPLLALLKKACVDASILVRKQAADSITHALEHSHFRDEMEVAWLNSVFPMINDREQSVQNLASKLVAETIVNPLLGNTTDGAWNLMHRIEQEDNHRRLLLRALFFQSKENQLNERVVNVLQSKLATDPERSDVVWMMLAELSIVFKVTPNKAVDTWFKINGGESDNKVRYIAKVLTSSTDRLTLAQKAELTDDMKNKLANYDIDAAHISSVYLCLAKLLDAVGDDAKGGSGWAILREYGAKLLSNCKRQLKKHLAEFTEDVVVEDGHSMKEIETRLVRVITTIGEVIQFSSTLVNSCSELVTALKTIMASDVIQNDSEIKEKILNSAVPSLYPTPFASRAPSRAATDSGPPSTTGSQETAAGSQPLSSQGNIIPSHLVNNDNGHFIGGALFTSVVRSYCVVALGKFCLMDESLAKECVPVLVKQLKVNDDHVLRNNIVLVICDLCIRYTLLVDRYSPVIAGCLKDRSTLVRLQTLQSLTNLIKEQFIRWEGQIMYRFVSTILDENAHIREYAEFCLKEVLLLQFPTMFYHHFIECLIYFNDVPKKFMPGAGEDINSSLKFSLSGEENVPVRMKLYKFMIETFQDKEKFITMSNICQQVIQPVLSGELAFEDARVVALLKDSFDIMSCKEIKLNMDLGKGGDDDDDDEPPAAVVATAKKMITETFRKGIIQCIMPPLLDIRTFLIERRSPLVRSCFAVLRAICREHQEQIDEFLAGDQQLKAEIEYEIKRFEARELAERLAAKKAEEEARQARRKSRRSMAVAAAMVAAVPQSPRPATAAAAADAPEQEEMEVDTSAAAAEGNENTASTTGSQPEMKPSSVELERLSKGRLNTSKTNKKKKNSKDMVQDVKMEPVEEVDEDEQDTNPLVQPSVADVPAVAAAVETTPVAVESEADAAAPSTEPDVEMEDASAEAAVDPLTEVRAATESLELADHSAENIDPQTENVSPAARPIRRSRRSAEAKDKSKSSTPPVESTTTTRTNSSDGSATVAPLRRSSRGSSVATATATSTSASDRSAMPPPTEVTRKRTRSARESTVDRMVNETVVTGRAFSTPKKEMGPDVTFADLDLSAIKSDANVTMRRSSVRSRQSPLEKIDEL